MVYFKLYICRIGISFPDHFCCCDIQKHLNAKSCKPLIPWLVDHALPAGWLVRPLRSWIHARSRDECSHFLPAQQHSTDSTWQHRRHCTRWTRCCIASSCIPMDCMTRNHKHHM